MSEWSELTWDDAMQRGYEALSRGEALYEEIDAEAGRLGEHHSGRLRSDGRAKTRRGDLVRTVTLARLAWWWWSGMVAHT
jgi:hypothetical protein